MTSKESDKIKLESVIDALYISPQYFENIEATECEIEIRNRLEQFKVWANNIIKKKLK